VRYATTRLADLEAVPGPAGLAYKPVRLALGLHAFGAAAFAAERAGEDVIEPHVETTDGRGHEELYVVMRGHARFVLDGDDEVDAPAGTLVRVAPDAHRHAIAVADGTEVLALGGPPTYEPAGSEWLWLAKARLAAGDTAGARALLEEALGELPESAAARHGLSLVCRAEGDEAGAERWRAEAIEREPRLADED
jgi:tetratricopeptide (TPR) repeat protein